MSSALDHSTTSDPVMVMVMVFNATFNNISGLSWRSVLLVEETRVPGENPLPQVTDKHYNLKLYQVHVAMSGNQTLKLVVIGTDCIGSCKSNYHTITMTPDIVITSNCIGKILIENCICIDTEIS